MNPFSFSLVWSIKLFHQERKKWSHFILFCFHIFVNWRDHDLLFILRQSSHKLLASLYRYAEKMKKLNELKAKKRNLEALISSLNVRQLSYILSLLSHWSRKIHFCFVWLKTLEIADYDELTEKIDKENQIRLCIEAQLLDPSLLLNSLKFFNLAAVWLLKIASVHTIHIVMLSFCESSYLMEFIFWSIANWNSSWYILLQKDTILDQLTIPLPHSPPQCYAYLPEYFVDSIADFLIFMAQYPLFFHFSVSTTLHSEFQTRRQSLL